MALAPDYYLYDLTGLQGTSYKLHVLVQRRKNCFCDPLAGVLLHGRSMPLGPSGSLPRCQILRLHNPWLSSSRHFTLHSL